MKGEKPRRWIVRVVAALLVLVLPTPKSATKEAVEPDSTPVVHPELPPTAVLQQKNWWWDKRLS